MTFENIIGNNEIKNNLKEITIQGNILHNYLFCGQEGIGKCLIAKEFARMILCLNNGKEYGCKCKSCIEFESNNHPDFLQIESDGNSIKIDQIRYMNSKIIEKPIVSSKKVYIINDSDKMTKEAQNSLLKTLEEPPQFAVIILICKQESDLLTTIKSRCNKIAFKNLSKDELRLYFSNNSQKVSDEILELSDGSILKVLELIPKQDELEKIKIMLENIEKMNKLDILKQDFIYEQKDEIMYILDAMNNIISKILINRNDKVKYINCIDVIEKTKEKLKLNSNFDMCIDNLLLELWEVMFEK